MTAGAATLNNTAAIKDFFIWLSPVYITGPAEPEVLGFINVCAR
jgi:hypothetical protein